MVERVESKDRLRDLSFFTWSSLRYRADREQAEPLLAIMATTASKSLQMSASIRIISDLIL